jgi:peroxin-16
MFVFQQKSWKPWLVSLLMDIASLHLHGGLRQFTSPRGKSEVVRRRLVLLLYLLRSPFYEKYSE